MSRIYFDTNKLYQDGNKLAHRVQLWNGSAFHVGRH